MALYMDVGPHDVLRVGDDTYLTIEYKSGTRTRLRIVGSADIELRRNSKPPSGLPKFPYPLYPKPGSNPVSSDEE